MGININNLLVSMNIICKSGKLEPFDSESLGILYKRIYGHKLFIEQKSIHTDVKNENNETPPESNEIPPENNETQREFKISLVESLTLEDFVNLYNLLNNYSKIENVFVNDNKANILILLEDIKKLLFEYSNKKEDKKKLETINEDEETKII